MTPFPSSTLNTEAKVLQNKQASLLPKKQLKRICVSISTGSVQPQENRIKFAEVTVNTELLNFVFLSLGNYKTLPLVTIQTLSELWDHQYLTLMLQC